MPKSVRTSRSRRSSQHNILNYSSDFDQTARRDSKWWRNLSDRSIRRSLAGDIRYRGNENAVLSEGSYPYGDVDSHWWKQLSEDESTILQRNAFRNRSKSNSAVEDDEKTAHESHTEHSEENVVRKTLFTDRQLRSGNHRFSKAFHLEQDQTNEPQVTEEETDTHNIAKTTNEKNKSTETIPRTGESLKIKVKRKTIQLFPRKPFSQRFSEAFHSADKEKIENEQQDESNLKSQADSEKQHSEIIVPATQESQETHHKSQFVQDTLGNTGEENIEVNETIAKNKTHLEITTHVEKKNLFLNTREKKRTFSAAFSKTAVDETSVDEEPKIQEKVSENTNDTVDTEINQSVATRKGLFEQKQTRSRKFSEAFSKTKHSIDKSYEDASVNQIDKSTKLVKRKSKSPRTSQIKYFDKNLDKISEEKLINERRENVDISTNTVRRSPRLSKNNDTNQMEMSENIQMKQNLFQAKIKETRKFSEAFSDTKNLETTSAEEEFTNKQEENNNGSENSRITRKSARTSKNNETSQMELNENVPAKNLFSTLDKKESRKFSDAFDKSKIIERNAIERGDNLPDNEAIERESVRSRRSSKQKSELLTKSIPSDENISVRKSLRSSKFNETSQMEINDNIQTKQDLFKAKVKETRKFSEAFAETNIIEKNSDEKELSDNQRDNNIDSVTFKISERKSTRKSENHSINQTDTNEMLATKKDLFQNKIKESRKFSEAFVKSTSEEKMDEKSNEYQEMQKNKSSTENKTDQSNDSSHLSTLPSINDTVGNDKKVLFKPKARKSLFSQRNTPNRMQKIDENTAAESDPTQQSSPAELTDQNGVFSDSVTSKFFETSLISSTKLVINQNLTRRNSTDDTQIEENQKENKNKSQSKKSLKDSNVPVQIKNVDHAGQESSQKDIDESEAQINKDKSQSRRSVRFANIPPQGTSMQTENVELTEQEFSQKEIDEPQTKSELTKNKSNVQSNDIYITSKKAPNEHEHTSAVENSKTKTSFKNTTLSNEDNSKESQISTNSGKRSSKNITDDIQTYISHNISSRVSTVTENTDKTIQDKSETRTSSHKNTSQFNLNDIENNVTDHKLNRASVQQDSDKNATETYARNSNMIYSTNLTGISNADGQSNNTNHKKNESIYKSLQSEFGENEQSKKSMSRTENNTLKKVLRFTENYENEIIEEEDETLNSIVSSTNSASKSLQTNITTNKSNRISVEQDADKNATEMQTQSNTTESNNKSVNRSLQSEYGEDKKSKKSMSRTENDMPKKVLRFTENDMPKKVLRFTENYENEIIDENEGETLNSNVLSTKRVSKSIQTKSSLIPIKVTEGKQKGNASLKPKNVNKTQVDDRKLQIHKELLLKAMNEIKPTTSPITTQQLPSKKITEFFSKINVKERPKIIQNKVTKPKPKSIPKEQLVNGQIYRRKKLFSGQRWCNNRFYKYLQDRMQDKYGENTILESEKLMKSIANSVQIISKSKQYATREIARLKKELARCNVISTTFDFYQLIENYLPYNIREKVVPCTRAHYAEPTVPYDHTGLFKTIVI